MKFLHREQTSRKEKIISAVIAFFYVFCLGTCLSSKPSHFYMNLNKPVLTPPNWVFPIVWTFLFILIALAGYWAWNHYEEKIERGLFAALYFANGILIYLWSTFFFGNNDPASAMVIIIGMIIIIEAMVTIGYRVNKKSGLILLPYFLWVLFASYLNLMILVLN